jgi:hypothetical protein
MINSGADSRLFEDVVRPLLAQSVSLRFQARGASMSPAIRDGEIVEISPVAVRELRKGDIVLAKAEHGFRLHRIVIADPAKDRFITRGDCGQDNDPALTGAQILGIARSKEVRIGRALVSARFKGVAGRTWRMLARAQYLTENVLLRARSAVSPSASSSR